MKDGSNLYLVYESGNRQVIASNVGSDDPLPVITSHTSNNLVLVYRTGNNLTSKHSTDNGSSWPTTKTISGTSLNSPSVANVNKLPWGDPTAALVYASGDNHVYYRYYDTSNWSAATNLSSIVPGIAVHQTPSISGQGIISQALHVAWYRNSGGSSNYAHTIIYRKSTTHDSWPNEYTQIYYEQQQRPTISAFYSNSVDILFQITTGNQIYKQHFDGFYWSGPVYLANGQYPSVSMGSSQAKYVWTSPSGPPYTVQLGSETLSKPAAGQPYYERAIAWLDSSRAYLKVQVEQMYFKTPGGTQLSLNFLPVSLDTVTDFTPGHAWNYLASDLALLPPGVDSLIVEFSLAAENLHKVGLASGGTPRVSLELEDAAGVTLASVPGLTFSASGNISETSHRISVAVSPLGLPPGSPMITTVMQVEGLNPRAGVFASLGHIYDFTKIAPKSAPIQQALAKEVAPSTSILLQNYPNPFNPETVIQYQLPRSTQVRLKIYNLLGQEIRTLVDGVQEAGAHEIRWDGKDNFDQAVASGIYLYRIEAGELVQVKKMALVR